MSEQGGAESAVASGDEKVSFLDQTLWRQLKDDTSAEAYTEAWLTLLCRSVQRVARAVVLLDETGEGAYAIKARWPSGEAPHPAMMEAAKAATAEQRGVVQSDGSNGTAHVAYPFLIGDRDYGAVAIEIASEPGPHLRGVMRQVQWGAAWMEVMLRRRLGDADRMVLERTKAALDFLATALDEEGFSAACTAVVTELATRLHCDRVSVGFMKRGSVAVATISHSARFGRRMKLIRQIGSAMDEALDQRTAILYPQDSEEDDGLVTTIAHRDLSHGDGSDIVLTLPLTLRDRFIGAVTLERPADKSFDAETIAIAESVVTALGPILDEKRRNDRWLIQKIGDSLWDQAIRLVGPGHVGRKLALACVVAVFVYFYFATANYRITATAQIEGLVRRAVVASFDGYIASAGVRAGDRVEDGELLATLDDKDLVLERLQWVTERQEKLKEYDQALAEANRARASIARVQIDAADAQIALIDEQLARARLVAPFDGLVVSGDLSQSIGGAVTRGEVLFEVAPLEGYRVILKVDESQIASVFSGQVGALRVSSIPGVLFPFTVDKVTPVAAADEGRNFFRVDAVIGGASDRLLPGMEGVGKIIVGERRLIWIWTRTLIDRARLMLWYWRP